MYVNWLAFTGVVALAYLIPGPDFAVILRSSTRGWRSGAAAAVGAQTGLCAHALLAVAGLSIVLARHPAALTTVRVLGGLYLLYLGGRLVLPTLRRRQVAQSSAPPPALRPRVAFGQALFTNLLNPKAVLFFAAILPQFVSAEGGSLGLQVAVLAVYDIVLGFVAWTLVIVLGVQLARVLQRDTFRRWWDRATGTALGGLGCGLLTVRT
jgi:threonine/homoserine/homoserine lactone efflux protein